jgi:hypothetical protein
MRRIRHGLNQDQESGKDIPEYSLVKIALTIIESNQALGPGTLTYLTKMA